MKNILLIIIAIFTILSCSSEERVINPQEQSSKLLVSTKDDATVKIVSLPNLEILNSDILAGKLDFTLNSPITFMKSYGDNLYLAAQKDYKLIILKKSSLELVTVIDFSKDQAEVGDFVFPNSTDCYVVHPNKDYISIIDITVFKVAKQVKVGNAPNSIIANGNQLIITNSLDNSLSIVDTRSRAEEANMPSSPLPSFSIITKDGLYAGIISLGRGKLAVDEPKSPAMLTFYNVLNRNEANSIEIGEGLISAMDVQPVGVVVTNTEWIYIASTTALFRADARTRKDLKFIIKKSFTSITNDDINSRLILTGESATSNDLFIASSKTGSIQKAIKTPFKIQNILVWQ
ncbi:MAG TPA: hypothetical protein PLE30_09315 [Candidatus Kapabacteria bacterium]|nr:hypothetical protein [Candidatus Kapabacteria bacterium]